MSWLGRTSAKDGVAALDVLHGLVHGAPDFCLLGYGGILDDRVEADACCDEDGGGIAAEVADGGSGRFESPHRDWGGVCDVHNGEARWGTRDAGWERWRGIAEKDFYTEVQERIPGLSRRTGLGKDESRARRQPTRTRLSQRHPDALTRLDAPAPRCSLLHRPNRPQSPRPSGPARS